ncbi:MAG TPA: outer membrane protein transport protein [bacterium]|nr:outer membrane protein transport protein [bacterium]
MKKKMKMILSIALFMINISCLRAQGFRNPPEGPASISQAGAFTAQCDDASAVTHNPAGLVQIEGSRILMGSTFVFPSTSHKSTFFSADKEFSAGYMPFLYYSDNFGSKDWRFGLGITSPYGQTTEWSHDSVRTWNYEVPYYSSMRTVNISPVMAFRFTPEFSAGGGLDICYSQLELNSLRVFPPPFPASELKEKIKADGLACGGILGLLYRKNNFSAGLTYKSGYNIKHTGTYRIPGLLLYEKASIKMQFPNTLSAGIAVYPASRLKMEFDTEWFGYSSLRNIPLSVSNLGTVRMSKNWKDAYMFSLGMEYKKSANAKLRAGGAYITSPVPSSTWEPSIPDADSFVISAGGEFVTSHGIFSIGTGVNILKTIKREAPYAGNYKSKGYFLSFSYRKEI